MGATVCIGTWYVQVLVHCDINVNTRMCIINREERLCLFFKIKVAKAKSAGSHSSSGDKGEALTVTICVGWSPCLYR